MKNYLPGLILLVLAMIISLSTYQNYGVGWDEPSQREIGYVSYNYAVHGDTALNSYFGKYHGPIYEMALVAIEQQLQMEDTRDIYFMRHIVNNIFFLLSAFCGYILFLKLYNKQWLALLGFLMLVYHPRIYMHSFMNTKDIIFLSLVLISSLISYLAFEKQRYYLWFLLGLVLGISTGVRILGIVPTTFISCFLLFDLISRWKSIRERNMVLLSALILLATYCFTLYACWPLLWGNPLGKFWEAFRAFSLYDWKGEVLFMGKYIESTELPWTYLPVWFCISMPMLWLFLGACGIGVFLLSLPKSPIESIRHTKNRHFIFYTLMLFVPFIMVIALKSVVYDDWRHVYFIYPFFILLGLYFVDQISRIKFGKGVVIAACTVQLYLIGAYIIKAHPFEYIYFNALVSKDEESLHKNYEMDYWGLSFRNGLEHVLALEKNKDKVVTFWPTLDPVIQNTYILKKEDRARAKVSGENWAETDYFITNYRYGIGLPPGSPRAVYHQRMYNSTILTVFDLKGYR